MHIRGSGHSFSNVICGLVLDTPGGRGTLILSSYVGLDLASTGYPKYIRNIKHPKKYLDFCNTKQYIHSVHLHLKKTLKYIKMTPKTNLICDFTKKYPQNFQNQKKFHFFWIPTPPPPPKKKKRKNEIQTYELKNGPS